MLLLACSACVEVEHDLTLYQDGSGVLHLEYGISELRVADMETFSELSGLEKSGREAFESPLKHFTEESIRKAFIEHQKHDVSLLSLSSRVENGWKYMRMEIGFESLTGLAKAGFVDVRSVSLQKTSSGDFRYSIRPDPAGGPSSDPMASVPGLAEEFSLRIRLAVPGEILETNGTRLSDRSVEWAFDGVAGAEAMAQSQMSELYVVFHAPEAEFPPFGRMHIRLPPPASAPAVTP